MRYLQPPPSTEDFHELKNWRDSLYEWVSALTNGTSGIKLGTNYSVANGLTLIENNESDDSIIVANTGVTITTNENGQLEVDMSKINHNYLLNGHNLTTNIDHNKIKNYEKSRHLLASKDTTLSNASDDLVPTQRAIKTYLDERLVTKNSTYYYAGKNGYTGGLNISIINDIVFLTGNLGLSVTTSQPVCNTLSSDFIPKTNQIFSCVDSSGNSSIIKVDTNGNITCNNSVTSTVLTVNGFWRLR